MCRFMAERGTGLTEQGRRLGGAPVAGATIPRAGKQRRAFRTSNDGGTLEKSGRNWEVAGVATS
jgi:hypothetical protein